MEKQESRKFKQIQHINYVLDPEALTHYFGNDDYREGNRILEQQTNELNGFSAMGNDLDENKESIDNKSDMPEFRR